MAVRTRRYTPDLVRARYSADERHRLLLDAAGTIVAESGIARLTIERLASTAVVSRALVYQHFASVGEVLLELLEFEWEWLEPRIMTGVEEARTFRDRLIAAVRPYLDAREERGPVFHALLIQRATHPDVLAAMLDYYRRVIGFWAAEVSAEFGLDRDEAVEIAVIFVGGFEAAAQRHWLLGNRDPQEVLDRFVELVIGALRHIARRKIGRKR